ncbi:MAG: hypothetical protein ACRDHN_20430, partial [Thermomicrobiales bacterium]
VDVEASKDGGKRKESVRQTNIDSFQWKDVDLIRVATGGEWSGVVLGALNTIEKSRPIIWISSRDCTNFGASVLAILKPLGKLGYVCVHSDEFCYIFSAASAGARSAATSRKGNCSLLIDIPDFNRKFLLIPGKEPVVFPGAQKEVVATGRTLASAENRVIRSDQGFLSSIIIPVDARFDRSHSQKVRRFGVGRPILPIGEIEQIDLKEVFERELEISTEPGKILLRLPAECAFCCDELIVSLAGASEGQERALFRRRMTQLENVNAVEIRFPLEQITRSQGLIVIRLLRDSKTILKSERAHSFESAHVSSDTVNCYLNRGGGGNPAIKALANGLG